MINLRFHIVSIVGIFLALAIGMLAGSTLLDGATVDTLKARQESLDQRNAVLRSENDRLRVAIESRGAASASFGTDVLPTLLPGLLTDAPALILATRGVDEDSVRNVQSAVSDAGGSPLGIVWFDSRFDLTSNDALTQIGAALELDDGPGDVTRSDVLDALTTGLVTASTPITTGTTTTTVAPTVPDPAGAGQPTTTVPTDPGGTGDTASTTDPDDPSLSVLSKLVDADLVDWESPTEGEPGSRTLPSAGLELILLSGEGADLRFGRFMYPLVRALAAQQAGVIVGEIRTPRPDLDVIDDPDTPVRGRFVDAMRADGDVAQRVITVDDVDEPFGRLAVVLALSKLPTLTNGAYGIAASADSPFPPTSG